MYNSVASILKIYVQFQTYIGNQMSNMIKTNKQIKNIYSHKITNILLTVNQFYCLSMQNCY